MFILPSCETAPSASPQRDVPVGEKDAATDVTQDPDNGSTDQAVAEGEVVVSDRDDSAVQPVAAAENPEAVPEEAAGVPDAQPEPSVAIVPGDYSPLSEAQRHILDGIVQDDPPEELNAIKEENKNLHFLWSDELHPELFQPKLENLGGTYIGIGTDQGYLFMGWQRPTLAFLVDYDPWVIYVHMIYRALFERCENADAFLAMLENKEGCYQMLSDYYSNDPDKKLILEIYKDYSRNFLYRARGLRSNMNKLGQKCFMNDDGTYQYIRKMIQAGRVRSFRANLLGEQAFQTMGRALHELKAPVTALYLSNAENYWNYNKAFRNNMLSLDYAPNGFVMRTSATKPINGDYRYSIQPAEVFTAWMRVPKQSPNVRHITSPVHFKEPDVFPFSVDTKMPKAEDEP